MKKSLILTIVILTISFLSAIALASAAFDDLSGKWNLIADAPGQSLQIAVTLTQTGDVLTGSTASDMGGGTIDGGKVTGKTFTATLHADIQGNPVDFAMSGTVDGDKMTGSFSNPQFGSIPFSATKTK